MIELFPEIEALEQGMLDVGDGHAIAWEVAGHPNGEPVVVLHGGPGQGSSPRMRRALDPARYRIVLFDQRGSGRSTPHASDPGHDLRTNTTAHLVGDMEALRMHLGIEQWLVTGGSWGTTLALAYAEKHPSRVSAMVLHDITTFRRAEIDWLYRGASRFFAEAWERFSGHVAGDGGELLHAYAARMEGGEAARLAAARAWCEWEDAVLSFEGGAGLQSLPPREQVAFARICCHYALHGAWLADDELIDNVGRIAHIQATLIHGRRDMSCPMVTAHELAQAWANARLVIVDDAGHRGSDSKRAALLEAFRTRHA